MEITAPECASDPGSLCQWVWDNTGADFLARNSDQVASSAIHILLILVIALIVRFLLYRAINRLTRLSNNDDTSAALGPLRAARSRSCRGLCARAPRRLRSWSSTSRRRPVRLGPT